MTNLLKAFLLFIGMAALIILGTIIISFLLVKLQEYCFDITPWLGCKYIYY